MVKSRDFKGVFLQVIMLGDLVGLKWLIVGTLKMLFCFENG